MPFTRIELLQAMPIFGAIRDDALMFLLEQTRLVSRRGGSACSCSKAAACR